MSIEVDWADPYADRRGDWRKGQLHAHTSPASDCAELGAQRVIQLYKSAGFDFLSLSDHMAVTLARDEGLALIPGMEWHSPAGQHTGLYTLDEGLLTAAIDQTDQRALLQGLADQEALVVLNHPNWDLTPHYRREDLEQTARFDGIEIYSALMERLPGYALAEDKWDYLLSRGRRVLGFVGDDSHAAQDIGRTWLAVRAPSAEARDILAAIRRGNFCVSSGVVVLDVGRKGELIEMVTENAQEIQVIGEGGCVLERVAADSIAFRIEGGTAYVRLTAYGPGSMRAWSQPFFI